MKLAQRGELSLVWFPTLVSRRASVGVRGLVLAGAFILGACATSSPPAPVEPAAPAAGAPAAPTIEPVAAVPAEPAAPPPDPSAVLASPPPPAPEPVAAAPAPAVEPAPAPSAAPTRAVRPASARAARPATTAAPAGEAVKPVAAVPVPARAATYSGPDPCTLATKGESPVAKACAEGGIKAAKVTMKELVKAGRNAGVRYQCDDCHVNDSDYAQLGKGADEKFARLLAAAGKK